MERDKERGEPLICPQQLRLFAIILLVEIISIGALDEFYQKLKGFELRHGLRILSCECSIRFSHVVFCTDANTLIVGTELVWSDDSEEDADGFLTTL
jgi:hypothetical protein